jgi:hypothetical protein
MDVVMRRRAPEAISIMALSAVSAGMVIEFVAGGSDGRLMVIAAMAAGTAAWVTLVHPRLTVAAFAGVLSVVPYAKVPGTDAPILLVLALGIWVACLAMSGTRFRVGLPELGLLALVSAAGLSVVATSTSPSALLEYVSWVAATAVVVPIRALAPDARRTLVGVFVAGCAVASAVGITLMRIDPGGALLGHLSFVGYRPYGDNAQYVPGVDHNSLRFTGTFVEPNIAGLVLAVGVLLAIGCTRGWLRALLVIVIGAGLALTLSRSALGTVVVALGLVVLMVPGRRRLVVAGTGALAGLALLAVPIVRDRLLLSFGPHDTGSLARELALQDFVRSLGGEWWWGLGWDREEFRSVAVGRTVNFVANAPLFTIYRGGVVVGGVAVLLLLLLVLRLGWVPRASFERLVLACGVAGFCLVALQLDFPVVIQHPATAVFSLLVGLSLGAPADAGRTARL